MIREMGILAIAAALIGGAVWKYRSMSDEVDKLRSEKSELEIRVSDLNGQIDRLGRESEAKARAAEVALRKAKADAQAAKARADDIYRQPAEIPQDLCLSALRLLNGRIP